MPRTSQTHPLRIASLPIANGHLGITICPGKQGESLSGPSWARDLETDIRAIRDWGATAIVTLIEEHEFGMLDVTDLPEAVKAAGIAWHHLPIRDVNVPDEKGIADWRDLSPRLHAIVEQGGRVLVHCRGGLGRAGLMAALLLVERGMAADDAIATVRAARPNAIETGEQEDFLRSRSLRDEDAQRLFAMLIGGATGDALGADIEFQSLRDIRARFPDGLNELPPHDGQVGTITDDTQMTLFTAEGLIRARIRGMEKGICHPPSVVHHALLRWLVTQGDDSRRELCDRGLIADPRLHARRAPGLTCLSSLAASGRFGDVARNDSKGCGTIMRVAPVAFLAPRGAVRETAIETSALTHGHPTGKVAAAAWAEMLVDVMAGAGLEQAARNIAARYADLPDSAETIAAIEAALAAPRDSRAETVETLGGGWVAEEALAIALYACLAAEHYEDGLRIAVTHGGDSDSTGAVAGAMLGLLHTREALAHRWTPRVQGADLVYRLVLDGGTLRARHEAGDLRGDYPGW